MEAGGGKTGGGRTHVLLALVIGPLTRHPFIDEAPFVTNPMKDNNNIWALIRFFHILHKLFSHRLTPSCLAVCGHHLSPRIAIVFPLLLLSKVPNYAMSHPAYCPHLLLC